jgi:hypothetical protein
VYKYVLGVNYGPPGWGTISNGHLFINYGSSLSKSRKTAIFESKYVLGVNYALQGRVVK